MTIVWYILYMLLCISLQILSVVHVQSACPCDVLKEPGSVNCSYKKLKYIPACVPESTKTLLLSHNRFKTLPGAPFSRFHNLEYLDLGFNSLQYLNNDSFIDLSTLRVLILSFNPLHDNTSYAKNVFQPLRSLEELHIEGTCDTNQHPDYNYIDDELSRIPSLKRLYLDGLSRRPLGPGFAVLEHLEEIYMDGYFGFCMLDSVNNNTFASLRKVPLRKLNMTSCGISFIYTNTFTDLKNLTSLILHDNRRLCSRGLKNLTIGLNTTSLKFLNLSRICKYHQFNISPDVLGGLEGTEIEYLDLASNMIEIIYPEAIFMLPKTLKYWSLRDNAINDAAFLRNLEILVNLIKLDGSFQSHYDLSAKMHSSKPLFHIGPVLRDSPEVLLPEYNARQFKNYSNVSGNSFSLARKRFNSTSKTFLDTSETDALVLPFKLQILNISYLKLEYNVIPLNFDRNNSLQVLDASYDLLKSWRGPWKGLNSLERLNLTNNRLKTIDPYSFAYMPNLRELLLGQNKIGRMLMRSDAENRMFLNLNLLEKLDLSDNGIRRFQKGIFTGQRKLKYLSIAGNSLIDLDFHVDSLVSLETLDLSGNQIQAFSKQFMEGLDLISKHTNVTIFLENNLLVCDCKTIDFVAWFISTKVYIIKHNISCQYQNKTLVSLMHISDIHHQLLAECKAWIVVLSCVAGFVFLILILSLISVVYYKRWNLKYLFSISRQNVNPYHPIEDREIEIEYDVYISYERDQVIRYNDTLHHFVTQHLYKGLRNRGLKVIIREELECGKMQYDIISNALRKCRKVIALVSKDYCSDVWNVYEFNMAALEGIYTKRQVLVPIVIGTISENDLSSDVYAFLKPQTVPQYFVTSPESTLINYLFEAVK